jgi:glycosyltransferase involved in cell wall biosynthesis
MWFASRGMVHKGLDLVLEAFAELPEYQLTVIGPVEDEPEFVNLYRRELYHTPNIRCAGWLDKGNKQFKEVLDQSVGHIFTSCSESGATGVFETMVGGVIPIVTYESSVDVEDYGIFLKDSSIEEIKEGVKMVAAMPASELKRRARKAWERVHAGNTRVKFAEAYRALIEMLLTKHGKLK